MESSHYLTWFRVLIELTAASRQEKSQTSRHSHTLTGSVSTRSHIQKKGKKNLCKMCVWSGNICKCVFKGIGDQKMKTLKKFFENECCVCLRAATFPLTLWMGSTTTATARSDSASKLCCVLMSTPDNQQPKPGWLWYQPTTISGLHRDCKPSLSDIQFYIRTGFHLHSDSLTFPSALTYPTSWLEKQGPRPQRSHPVNTTTSRNHSRTTGKHCGL